MLRYSFLAGFLLLNANAVFSQVLWIEQPEKSIHYYKQRFHLPEWARSFADSTLRKVGLPASADLRSPVSSKDQRNLPPGVKPADYIGRDGLPGDPLPAVMFVPRSIEMDKLRQFMIDDWEIQQRIEEKLQEHNSK